MAKSSFGRIGARSRRGTFFIVTGIVLVMTLITLLGMRLPVPGFGVQTVYGVQDIRKGIDINGGFEAIFAPAAGAGNVSDAELDAARSVMELRMDKRGIVDREITVDKIRDRIIIRVPWKADEKEFDPGKAIAELGETARLTFRDPEGTVVLEGKHVKSSYPAVNQQTNEPVVVLELKPEGTTLFAEATGKWIGDYISIYMDDELISSPQVKDKITTDTAEISPMESVAEAKALADKINGGALPFALEAIGSNIISPTLGQGALQVMVVAGLIAFAAVCLFMILYYRLPGAVACIALLAQTMGQLLAISAPQFTLTLPGIAGIILSVGMGVDANVIISEQIREELAMGNSLRLSIANGFTRAFSAVADGNVTVAIAAIILIIFGSSTMLSFGYALLVGVILNTLTGVLASRLMIGSLSQWKPLQKAWLYGGRRNG